VGFLVRQPCILDVLGGETHVTVNNLDSEAELGDDEQVLPVSESAKWTTGMVVRDSSSTYALPGAMLASSHASRLAASSGVSLSSPPPEMACQGIPSSRRRNTA
jgi:hypothetical protein